MTEPSTEELEATSESSLYALTVSRAQRLIELGQGAEALRTLESIAGNARAVKTG